MRHFLILVFSLVLIPFTDAQWCATDGNTFVKTLESNLQNLLPVQRGAVKYVPITFHLVADAAGLGRVTEEQVLLQVANLNAQYADQEFIFYIDRFSYIDHDLVYDDPTAPAAESYMQTKRDNNSINIWISNQIAGPDNGGVANGVYITNRDWIILKKGVVNLTNYSGSHEVGHFFSLEHTFFGWECVPYTLEEYGNPVTRTTTKPCEGGGGSLLIELHNGSNCATAGDRICDTPEDYCLGLFFQPGCDENTQVRDKNNELITPMINNVMSYYTACSTYVFTQTQKNVMNTDFLSGQRAYIRTGNIPSTTPVTEEVSYITPVNGQETSGASNILLDWDDVPGANKYLVIYARNASFSINPVKAIVNTSNYTITETLNTGFKYYWKVWPYNESQTGAMYSPTQNFLVGENTAVNEIIEVEDFVIHPNPVQREQIALLTLSSTKSIKGQLKVLDLAGHVIENQFIEIPSGETDLPLPVGNLTSGVYFIVLETNSGRLVERLMVAQ